jgi:hypothetical protein
LYKHQGFTKCKKSEWLVFEGHHEPIISSEDFEIVQKMRPVKKVVGPKQDNYFRGIIFCKKCGSKMVMQMTGKHPAYVCGKKDSYGKEACVMPYIHKDYVYETVHRVLAEQMQLLLDADKVLRQINSSEKMDSYLQSPPFRGR